MYNMKRVKLKDITTKIGSGATPLGGKTSYKTTGIAFIRSLNIFDLNFSYDELAYITDEQANKLNNVTIEPDDILLNITGASVARCCILPKNLLPARVNQHVSIIRIKKELVNPYFVQYLLVSPYYKQKLLSIAQGGATREALTKESIENFEITIPNSKKSQDKIANILLNYDKLIENNNKRIKILEELAQKIYKEWFIDFKFPNHETATFKQSELGKIPSDWNSKPIGELLEHQIGGGWGNEEQSDKYTESAYVIRGADIPNGRNGNIQNCPLRYHTKSNIKTRLLKVNDIVFEVSGGSKGQPVGRALLLNKNLFNQFNDNVICASFCKLLRTDTKQILPEIVYLHLLNIYNNGKIEKYQTQSTGIINFKFTFFLENEQILVPNDTIQELFKNITVPIFDEISLLGYKNQALKQTRDLLLPRLISGEIDVENMEVL